MMLEERLDWGAGGIRSSIYGECTVKQEGVSFRLRDMSEGGVSAEQKVLKSACLLLQILAHAQHMTMKGGRRASRGSLQIESAIVVRLESLARAIDVPVASRRPISINSAIFNDRTPVWPEKVQLGTAGTVVDLTSTVSLE